jgi:hypothetical protein
MTPTERRLLNDFANGQHNFEPANRADVERLQRLGLIAIKDFVSWLQGPANQGGLAVITAEGADAVGAGFGRFDDV